MTTGDLYEILGVNRAASRSRIQRAYRELARKYHPDVNPEPDAERRFRDLAEAYAVLSQPEQRRRYDARAGRTGPDGAPGPDGGPGHRGTSGPGRDADGRRGRAGATGRTRDAGTTRRARGPARGGSRARYARDDFEDLFGNIFRGRGRRHTGGTRAGPITGGDREARLDLTVEEAYRGGPHLITIAGQERRSGFEVDIPPGVVEGQRLRVRGKGAQGGDGGLPGDLYLVVRLRPHPRYRVEGRDVHVQLPVAPWEAALGATMTVETLAGDATVRVPAGSSGGRRLRLRGHGLPNPHGAPGDMFAELRIVLPSRPTREERRLLQELAAAASFHPRRPR